MESHTDVVGTSSLEAPPGSAVILNTHVVLLDKHHADEADQRCSVREDVDDVGTASHLFVSRSWGVQAWMVLLEVPGRNLALRREAASCQTVLSIADGVSPRLFAWISASGTTSTGIGEWWISRWLKLPRRSSRKPPSPRRPTTRKSPPTFRT